MKIESGDMDPLRIKEWFKRSYSIPVTIVLFFVLVLYPSWLYVIDWFQYIMVNGLSSTDLSFIKALSFILLLMSANISYMVLSKNVSLSRTVEKQESELHLLDENFRKFMDDVPNVAIQGFDKHLFVQYWNSASETMYGYSKEEAIGQKMTDLIVPIADASGLFEIINSGRTDQKMERFCETTFLTKSKMSLPVFSSYSTVLLPGDQLGIFSMEIDLTERKLMETELMVSKDLAEASNNAKSEFISNVSHELRTPLNSIIGFSDLLVEGGVGPLNEKQVKYAKNISSSGTHLLGLINNILDLSKAEAGKMELSYEKVILPQFLLEMSEFMGTSASKRGIKISTLISPDVYVLEVDSGKLKQILYNLIGNAIKFSNDGGDISVECRMVQDYVEFEVRDGGIGIKEDDLDKLFKPFSQINSSSQKKYNGTGLGLSLVKKFVELHGGHVWVKSEYGMFSIFGFAIPLENFE
ncbi:PAS domain-containing sensor histidine kinase [Methanococcoides orientis]|uniref:PAS domain-containing sensor histidine kinase n=1 Tax=Methanococcoides orientis TaxID=2822137 RepID=UPI001E33CD67|nr:PAS domain-containing sensor histidine kinase [Methanococcoides orientis]UGV40820.1 PAS domain-containing sensor histidine kinase [Methanococcoides orientis]